MDILSDIKDISIGHLSDIQCPLECPIEPLSVRYKKASLQVLENLRNTGSPRLTEVMTKYNCLLSDNPTEEELMSFRKFREDIYPAVARLKDLQAKTIEAIHAKSIGEDGEDRLHHERFETLTGLLKTIDHDIEVAEGRDSGRVTNNVFIFNDERAKRIAERLTARNDGHDRFTVEEESN